MLDLVGIGFVVVGGALALRAAVLWWRRRTPDGNLLWMRTFRAVVFGLSAVMVGVGLWGGWPVLIALGLVIGFEETIETSIAIWALKQEKELEARYPLTG